MNLVQSMITEYLETQIMDFLTKGEGALFFMITTMRVEQNKDTNLKF